MERNATQHSALHHVSGLTCEVWLLLLLCYCGADVMNLKNLQRIFPVDDSMVMIIDDRVDVWGTSKNLIKIEPCTLLLSSEPVVCRHVVRLAKNAPTDQPTN